MDCNLKVYVIYFISESFSEVPMEIIKENENNILREKFEKIDPDSRLYIYFNYNAESTDEEICASVERARG